MVNNVTRNLRAPASLRRAHRSLALNEVLMTNGISRTGLADELGLSQMAMSRIVRDLFNAGLVKESGIEVRETGPGRRQRILKIRPEGAYAAAIALSAYSAEIAIITADGEVLVSKTLQITEISDGVSAIRKLAKALNRLIDEALVPRQRIAAVGVVVAAQLDPDNLSVVSSNMLDWKPFHLVEEVSSITQLPTYAENIVNALTLAEVTVGALKQKENVIVVRSATTLGASILQHGQLVRGLKHPAGRIGHFQSKKTKLFCACGSNHCLNCSASGWSVLARLGKTPGSRYQPDDIADYANEINQLIETDADSGSRQSDDLKQSQILKKAGAALGKSLLQLNQFLEPQAIVLNGSMSRVLDYQKGISQALETSDEGKATLEKINYGKLRAVRAAGILALKNTIYTPLLDFEQVCETANATDSSLSAGSGALQ